MGGCQVDSDCPKHWRCKEGMYSFQCERVWNRRLDTWEPAQPTSAPQKVLRGPQSVKQHLTMDCEQMPGLTENECNAQVANGVARCFWFGGACQTSCIQETDTDLGPKRFNNAGECLCGTIAGMARH